MAACIHGEVCREYLRQHKGIICQTCPTGCRFYEPKRERTCHAVRIAVPFDPRDFPDDLVEVYQFRCSECSVLLEDDWSFCPNCGAKVLQE